MGFIADIKAIKKVARVKSGGTAKLSISQITCLITNMLDAKKSLSSSEFEAVHALYKDLRKCTTKMEMDKSGYIDTAVKIIRKFDKIAPYEKYSGGNELEFSFLMDDVRETSNNSDVFDMLKRDDEEQKYMDYIIEKSLGQVNQDEAREIMRIIHFYHKHGKADAISEFDILVNNIIEKNGINATFKVSFMSGLLYSNGILTKEESDELSRKYVDQIMEAEFKSDKQVTLPDDTTKI